MDTETRRRVFREAEALGVVQVHLTGGEPLVRLDLESLIEEARALDLYTNLITSGIPLTRERLARFRQLGLDAVQVSVQDVMAPTSDRIAGLRSFDRKLAVARWVKDLGFPLTLNVVLHRDNLGRIEEVVALAEALGADRLELANTQYLGWALLNRPAILPTRAQLDRARRTAAEAKQRLRGRMEVLFVLPDYYSEFPKACMDGWGRRFILVCPDGLALPCHVAHTLPGNTFENVREHPLEEIWRDSPGFNRYRGEEWMAEPCRSCDRRAIDYGGCRCQAFHLTGDAAATDPACSLSPHHRLVEAAREHADREAGRPCGAPIPHGVAGPPGVRRQGKADASLWILLALVAVAVVVALGKDAALPLRGLAASARLFGGVWVELAVGFLLEVLLPRPAISRWLGAERPARGILVGWGAGLIIPGGPYLVFPAVANLFRNGAAPGPLIALVTAKTLVSPIRMLTYEAPLLGWPLTLARFIPGVLLPPLMGLVGQWLFAVFARR
jgi:pyrroloquinoline quinone biosynthesis protein E